MNIFRVQSISREKTWGEQLREARELARWSLADAAYELQMREEYIYALESMDITRLPGVVYARYFLERYAQWLGIDIPPLLKSFDREVSRVDSHGSAHLPLERVSRGDLRVWPHVFRRISAGVLAAVFLIYLGFSLYNIVRPPDIQVDFPEVDMKISDLSLRVKGQTDPEVDVYVNGSLAVVDSEGYFERLLSLQPGVNKVVVEASRRFSRTARLERQVLVEDNDEITAGAGASEGTRG